MIKMAVTGLTVKEFERALNKEECRCYICKRKFGDKGVLLSEENEDVRIAHYELRAEIVELESKEGSLKFLLCQDCMNLFKVLLGRFESQKDDPGSLFENRRERINSR